MQALGVHLAVRTLPRASVKVKSSGAAGTPTSSQDAPQVLRMLIGPWLCPDCSNALCSEAFDALTTCAGQCKAQRNVPQRQSYKLLG